MTKGLIDGLTIVVAMIAGLVVLVAIFVLRIVGVGAAIAGGFGLLATLGAYTADSHAQTAAHWLALEQSSGYTAACIGIIIVAWYGPMWLFSQQSSRL